MSDLNATLVYGIDLGDEETREFELPEVLAEYDSLREFVTETHLGLPPYYTNNEFNKEQYQENCEAYKAFGVDLDYYGTEYWRGTALVASASSVPHTGGYYSNRLVDIAGYATPEKVAEYDAALDRIIEILDLDFLRELPRGWLLLAQYG